MRNAVPVAFFCALALGASPSELPGTALPHEAVSREAAEQEAQERLCPPAALVHSRVFTLISTRLTIDVDTEVPGDLRILRGGNGLVEVLACTDGGLPGFSLSTDGQPRLHLTGIGTGGLTWLVVVPDRVWLSVRLPDRLPEAIGTLTRSATFRWSASG